MSKDRSQTASKITLMLQRASAEGHDIGEALLPLVYEELRAIAARRMAKERPDHTLQATALVHEAYLKLVGLERMAWRSRGQFYLAAAQAMQRILVDYARRRGRHKRGAGARRMPMSLLQLAADQDPEEIVALNEAIQRLEEEDGQAAKVVQLRYFAGLSVAETARAMEVSPRTVAREWEFARAKLFRALQADG